MKKERDMRPSNMRDTECDLTYIYVSMSAGHRHAGDINIMRHAEDIRYETCRNDIKM